MANVGHSPSAVTTNSACRGLSVAIEIAVLLHTDSALHKCFVLHSRVVQDPIGDGCLYTLYAGLMLLTELMILLVLDNGGAKRKSGW